MANKKQVIFWLDETKHSRLKTKVSAMKSDITTELTKFVDAFIGKLPIAGERKTEISSEKPPEAISESKPEEVEIDENYIPGSLLSPKQEVINKLKQDIGKIVPPKGEVGEAEPEYDTSERQ